MITSFSLPGFPSLLSFRIALSCAAGPCAFANTGEAAAVTPNAESTDANRTANILRVRLNFIDLLLFQSKIRKTEVFENQGNAKLNTSLPAAIATYCFPATE